VCVGVLDAGSGTVLQCVAPGPGERLGRRSTGHDPSWAAGARRRSSPTFHWACASGHGDHHAGPTRRLQVSHIITCGSSRKCMCLPQRAGQANVCDMFGNFILLNRHTLAVSCRLIAAATVRGALQLARIGATLAARPLCNAMRITNCMLLVYAHLWLPQAHPHTLAQVPMS
jgi:hypothetical protein